MDPNACLRLILDAVADGDRDQLTESLTDLREWLDNGGAMPSPVVYAESFS